MRAEAALIFLTLSVIDALAGEAARLPVSEVHVINGDTIQVAGHLYRLVGFDTPETWRAQCSGEALLGKAATDRLRQLVASAGCDARAVAYSCAPDKPEETSGCNYGRRCGTLHVDGEDVGAMREHLAKAYPYRWDHPPRKPAWCEG
jgi:endonuclease YncB( thermonuclease family)